MEFRTTTNHFENIENDDIRKKIKELYDLCLGETLKGNKVSFYYEDLNNNVLSFNENICFYAASSIKILVCLLMFKLAEEGKINLEEKLLITKEDIFEGTGVIKNQTVDTEYSIDKLIELTITESDNTAYIKLVRYVGKDKLKEFGLSLGAIHTLESNDSYGIISATDMIIYWKALIDFINNHENGKKYKKYLLNPSYKIIEKENYLRKYGYYDIAYHEAGYVEGEKPYYLIVLTQLGKFNYKKEFVNKVAKLLDDINNI